MDKVIFRKWPDGTVIALLPDQEANPGHVQAYEHIGQHGEASLRIVQRTKLAKPDEYAPLLRELIQIGYKPRVMARLQRS